MMHAAAYGRLGQDPRPIETASGKPMTVGTLAVTVEDRNAEGGEATLWLGLVAFGRQAEDLARHGKGDALAVSGRIQSRRWTGDDGQAREQLQVVADAIVGTSSVRPRGGKRGGGGARRPAPDDFVADSLDDWMGGGGG